MAGYTFKTMHTVQDMLPFYDVIRQMPYTFDKSTFANYLSEMIPHGYSLAAVFEKEECVAVSGYWINTKLFCGRYVELDNVVVAETHRGKGAGKFLCREIEKEARRIGCNIAVLDAYVENHRAHRFYLNEEYSIRAFHFYKKY